MTHRSNNLNSNNFDAPLIGDLKWNTDTTTIHQMDGGLQIYGGSASSVHDPLPSTLSTGHQFYDSDALMMAPDMNNYVSPPLGFAHQYSGEHHLHSSSLPRMHLDHSTAVPTVPSNNVHINSNSSGSGNNSNSNTSASDTQTMPALPVLHDAIDDAPPPAPFDDTLPFNMDMMHDHHHHDIDDDHFRLFGSINHAFSNRSEFGEFDADPQLIINNVSDITAQFLTPLQHSGSVPLPLPPATPSPVAANDIDVVSPPPFIEITRNIFVSRARRRFSDLKHKYRCDCHHVANGDDCARNQCYNRMFFYECTDESCAVQHEAGNAALCRNRRFQRREWKKVRVARAHQKGFGLFTDERIERGEFIIEYVGEIIDEAECKQRLATTYVHAQKFFILKLEGGTKRSESIDATAKGCAARFMNHSCAPNCKAQKWTIGAEIRLGFFAARDIECGEELTFDYHFQRYGNLKQKCFCGAIECRKYLGGKPLHSSSMVVPSTSTSSTRSRGRKKRVLTKIVQRSMDERVVVAQCFDYLCRLSETPEHNQDAVLLKCLAKGRLLRRHQVDNVTHPGLLQRCQNGAMTFEALIKPYASYAAAGVEAEATVTVKGNGKPASSSRCEKPMPVWAVHQFETLLAQQLQKGVDVETPNLSAQLQSASRKLRRKTQAPRHPNGDCQCVVRLMYGANACKHAVTNSSPAAAAAASPASLSPHHHHQNQQHLQLHRHRRRTPSMDKETVQSYLKLKQESESLVKESKIKNNITLTAASTNSVADVMSYQLSHHGRSDKSVKTEKKDKLVTSANNNNGNILHQSGESEEDNDDDDDDDAVYTEQKTADSQYAANLHKQLNKPHLRSRRSACSHHHHSDTGAETASSVASAATATPTATPTPTVTVILQTSNNNNNQSGHSTQFGSATSTSILDMTSIDRDREHPSKRAASKTTTKSKHQKKVKEKRKQMFDEEEDAKILICPKCGIHTAELKTKGTWSRHLHSKHTYNCKSCRRRFTTASTLSEHEKTEHPQLRSPTRPRKSKTETPTQTHSPTRHASPAQQQQQTTTTTTTPSTTTTTVADVCDKCGRDRGELPERHWLKHLQTDHRYPCPHCALRFAHIGKYNEHIRAHNLHPETQAGKRKHKSDGPQSLEEDRAQQPHKKRKLKESSHVREQPTSATAPETGRLSQARDKELELYRFAGFEGYEEEDEMMVSIWNKIEANDTKFTAVFEREEGDCRELCELVKQVHSDTSIFNKLIFTPPTTTTTMIHRGNASVNPTTHMAINSVVSVDSCDSNTNTMAVATVACAPPPRAFLANPATMIAPTPLSPQQIQQQMLLAAHAPRPIILHDKPPSHAMSTLPVLANIVRAQKEQHANGFTANPSQTATSHNTSPATALTTANEQLRIRDRRTNHHYRIDSYHHPHHRHHSNGYHNHSHNSSSNYYRPHSHQLPHPHHQHPGRDASYTRKYQPRFQHTASAASPSSSASSSSSSTVPSQHVSAEVENKTLFVDGIPLECTEDSVRAALRKHGSIKSLVLKTKQNKRAQYAQVVCFQKHICESLIAVGQKPIALQLSGGQWVEQKLLIQYHNQRKVDEARERRLKEMQTGNSHVMNA